MSKSTFQAHKDDEAQLDAARKHRETVTQFHEENPDRPALPEIAPDDRINRPPRSVPFDGQDRTGLPTDLARAERRAHLGMLPGRRSIWPDLAQYDRRTAELQDRQGGVASRITRLRDDLVNAPSADAQRRADFELAGATGTPPEPSKPAIEAEMAALEVEREGLEIAVERVLEEKARSVETNRTRLVAVAQQQTEAAHARCVDLLDQLSEARANLVELRSAAVWAAVWPHETATHAFRHQALGGGLRSVTQAAGLETQADVGRLLAGLKADVDWLLTAATPEQRAAITGRTDTHADALWVSTPEGAKSLRDEKAAARQRYANEWGEKPSEF